MASFSSSPELSEAQIQNQILDYLTKKGYTCWRQNTAGIYNQQGGFYRKPSKYHVNGVSDIIVLSEGKAYFIEVKSHSGRQEPDQVLFQKFVERAGCEYILAYCLEDVMEAGF